MPDQEISHISRFGSLGLSSLIILKKYPVKLDPTKSSL